MLTKKKHVEKVPPSPEDRQRAAAAMVDGTACGVVTARYLEGIEGGANGLDVEACIAKAVRSVADGDLTTLERMLLQQAATLQAMFVELAFRSRTQTSRENLQTVTSLALKAAAGSRQAITALAELRMPKQVLFAKQANVNNGGQQQVNNGGAEEMRVRADARPRTANFVDPPSELLERHHGQWMDPRAQSAAGGADPRVEAVGEVHRPPNA